MAEDLTVIVIALLGGEALDQCTAAARAQCSKVLAVGRDGTIVDSAGSVIGVADRPDIPAKRRCGVELATTPLVALLEDTVVPEKGWADAVATALDEKEVVACGGPVMIAEDLSAQTRALTLSEYGRYHDRQTAGEVVALPGCNFAFRREPLLKAMRASDGLVDLPVFRGLKEDGGKLIWAPGMVVTFEHAYADGARLRTRFDHGRIYAASLPGRASTAAKALLLPAVLTARTLSESSSSQVRSIKTLGWLMLQHTAWAAGEFAGAVFGPSRKGLGHWR